MGQTDKKTVQTPSEGSLELKPLTIWTDGKAEVGRFKEEKKRNEKIREEKAKKKEDAGARKGGKVAIHCVYPMICSSGGSKSRLAKAAGAEPSSQMRDENCTPLWREANLEVQKVKTPHIRPFGALLEVQMSNQCTPLWREAHFQLKMYKAQHSQTTFGSSDVEPVHAGVARSTFPSQKCKKLTASDHFWKMRC